MAGTATPGWLRPRRPLSKAAGRSDVLVGVVGQRVEALPEAGPVGQSQAGVNLKEGNEHEPAGGDLAMGQLQTFGFILEVTQQQEVYVDHTGRVTRAPPFAPLFPLDQLEYVEQILRAEISPDPNRGVKEIGLVKDLPDRLGPPGRGDRLNLEAFLPQTADRVPQVGEAVAYVGAKAEPGLAKCRGVRSAQWRYSRGEGGPKSSRLRLTSTEAPSITTGIGGSGLLARTVTLWTGN